MKTMASSVVLALSVALPAAYADDRHHPAKGSEVAAGSSLPSSPPDKGMGMMMDMDRMQEMHKMMERIHQSKDPAERQRLMQEHMEQMHKMMSDMQGMMGKGTGAGMSAEDRQQMMQKRMDMMQGMMEQMMEHIMAAEGMPVKKESAGMDGQREHEDKGKRRRVDMP